jgi:hypothetical protein
MARSCRSRLPLLAALLAAVLAGCYVPSAGRRSAQILERGWDPDERGALMIVTGPVSLVHATLDFTVHALVPLDYDGYFLVDRREPPVQWFRRYGGPMRPLADVSILCHVERATFVEAIRDEGGAEWRAARNENWQFPKCIEVLPGRYELAVSYLKRSSEDARDAKTTSHVESTEPSTVRWTAEAGGAYLLRALFGEPKPAPGPTPRSRLSRSQSLGTSWLNLEVSDWLAEIERVPSWQAFGEPVLEHRAAWARYESVRR